MNDLVPAPPPVRRLIDPASGREVEILYVLPPELCAQPAGPDQGVDIQALINRLWQGRYRILATTLLGGLIAATVAMTTPATYTASVTAMPPAEKGGGAGKLGQYADLAAMAGVALPGGGGGSVEEILAILDSRTLKDRLIERFALKEYYEAEFDEDAVKSFSRDFTARHDKKAGRITISVMNRVPVTAAELANAAAAEMQVLFNEIHQSSSKRERAFLESRLKVAEQDLANGQAKLADFQRAHHTIEIQSQTRATVEAVSKLQGELIAQQIELRARLASQASADNPQVQLLQQRVEGMTKAISDLAGNGSAEGGGILLGLGALPELSIEYLGLFREVKKGEAMVTTLVSQIEGARISEVRDSEVISIIDHARTPVRKTGPKRAQMGITGLVLGGLAGLALVLLAPMLARFRPQAS
jgi:uncharacterized protein involved in exopolysaccharide biosynthesis